MMIEIQMTSIDAGYIVLALIGIAFAIVYYANEKNK